MRGSPIIRFLLVTLALLATGAGLAWLTSGKAPAQARIAAPVLPFASVAVPYSLQLSSEAAEIALDTGISKASAPDGTFQFDPANPYVSISIRWKTPPAAGEQRFAKLTLEQPNKPTLIHVFDSAGNIDDLLELPLSP